ncbi:hypothetical protein SELSPUOL_00638 [Selenomonas sputigena ATCC 35185]|uniref:Uncharacterized protein n=1 Tax=Selenomonas sputigena (strain ATCC 35185 / DSM 20758 / CCUG 44933 / VPI D19B-28) TaxID=546271 RepID=C9LT58_SELS3|nr:hypothetical protein SELSPUOL_00638 [Selenomonas sputigena ATCC 35185]
MESDLHEFVITVRCVKRGRELLHEESPEKSSRGILRFCR